MLARLRKEENEGGFTLIELLVVMIIIGILAAIAIPVFLSQRAKAQDSAAKADVSTIGKEIATYFVDSSNVSGLAVADNAGRWELTGGDLAAAQDLGKVSTNVAADTQTFVSGTAWCVSVTNPEGDKAKAGYRYSAAGGLETGVCP